MVNALLMHSISETRRHCIDVEENTEFPKYYNIITDDLSVILVKLLDNAIETCQKYIRQAQTPPRIEVTLRRIHQFLIIKIQNPCVPPRKLFGIFPTTKADARHHGIGLRNVLEKVEKYNGSLEIEVESEVFTATALLFFE